MAYNCRTALYAVREVVRRLPGNLPMLIAMKTYTTAEAAEQLEISYAHLRALLTKGECPVPENRIGTGYVWFDADIKKFRKWLTSRPERRGRPKKSGNE